MLKDKNEIFLYERTKEKKDNFVVWLAFPAINPATPPTVGTAKIPVASAPHTPDIP